MVKFSFFVLHKKDFCKYYGKHKKQSAFQYGFQNERAMTYSTQKNMQIKTSPGKSCWGSVCLKMSGNMPLSTLPTTSGVFLKDHPVGPALPGQGHDRNSAQTGLVLNHCIY